MWMAIRSRGAESPNTRVCIFWECHGCIAAGQEFCLASGMMPLTWRHILQPTTQTTRRPLHGFLSWNARLREPPDRAIRSMAFADERGERQADLNFAEPAVRRVQRAR